MQAETKQTIRIWWRHTKVYKFAVAYVVLGLIISNVTSVIEPYLLKVLVDLFTVGNFDEMNRVIWYLLALAIFGSIVWRPLGYVYNHAQPRVMSDLYNTCYEYILGHSYGFFTSNFSGAIQKRIRQYQGSYERFTDTITWELSRTILMSVFVLGIIIYRKPQVGLLFAGWTLFFVLFTYATARYKLKHDQAQAEQDTVTSGHLADTVNQYVNIKVFAGKEAEIDSFRKITDRLYFLRRKTWNLGSHANTVQGTAMILLQFFVLRLMLSYAREGKLELGDFVMIQTYMLQMFGNLWTFGTSIKNIYESFADANEMTVMLLEPHEVVDTPGATELVATHGKIEFKNVDFSYIEDASVFENFNLTINPGQKVALVGPSGGGKSTIIKLLLRFQDIKGGQILIDGQSISDVSQKSLWKSIAVVPQDASLFHRTLLENIRYGKPDATFDEVVMASKAAHAHEFISKFPKGYHTYVGERGVKLSGGERQRVAIAMAILKNAPILVLDEATSSLDSESESFIQDALHTLMRGRTTISIAHRLSTIRDSDPIVVIEDGEIIQQGKHEELLKTSGVYQKLWKIQVNGFEMAVK
jgi:ATP-binding cassette subfamily B protein